MLETEFTPFASLLGGALIGLSAVILMASHGRVAGISGIVSRVLPPAVDTKRLPQGLTFIVGLLLVAPLWFGIFGQAPVVAISSNMVLLGIAGILVGFGSVLGNGCTSGHGVCGISRLSGRSIIATVTFMATGAATVFILRYVVGAKSMRILSTLFAGLLFGTGLILSGMANPTKVQNFLDVFGTWDPSLAFVMGGAILVTAPGFWFVQKRSTPFFHDMFHLSTRKDVDARLLTGAALFGVGWGLGGLCPGPVVTSLPFATTGVLVFVPTMLVGMSLAKFTALPSRKFVAD